MVLKKIKEGNLGNEKHSKILIINGLRCVFLHIFQKKISKIRIPTEIDSNFIPLSISFNFK